MEPTVEHALGISSIHATLVAIIFGVILAYVAYAQGKSDELTTAVLLAADRIDDVGSSVLVGASADDFRTAQTPEGRKTLTKRFHKQMGATLAYRVVNMPPRPEHLKDALVPLSTLVNSYPFRPMAQLTPDGGIGIGPSSMLRFGDVNAVRIWLAEIEPLVRELRSTINGHDLDRLLSAHDALAAQEWAAGHERNLAAMPPQAAAALRTRIVAGEFGRPESLRPFVAGLITALDDAASVVAETKKELARLDKHTARLLPLRYWIGLLVLTAIFFAVVVLLPMARVHYPNAWSMPAPWAVAVPGTYYLLMMSLAIVWMRRLF